jgi:uncharacterized damage-inducible protein DinB
LSGGCHAVRLHPSHNTEEDFEHMNDVLLTLYRHMTWATLQVIEFCQGLDEAHLGATVPGTYGTVRETLAHLVRAEEGYLSRITNESLPQTRPDGQTPLAELSARIRRMGPEWERVAQDDSLPGGARTTDDGWRVLALVPMAQAIHHACEHRAHVLTILGARGVQAPDPDVWSYAEAHGLMHQIGQPPADEGN